ncbi:sporulation protein [Paenisporosarcina sp. NPDC076898]|uniref:sporulation protein n=1 Tax=unclassified Paenisporosarcina TaxID=2642018 RepID=UPI003D03ED04
MILRKYMALIGIGSAKIDLILEKDTYSPGELVKGYFLVKGGTIEQQLKRIECDLVVTTDNDEVKDEKVIDSIIIFTSKLIESNATNQIPFTFRLPKSMQPAFGASYRFKSRLSFKQGVESLDHDVIQILAESV